MDSSPANQQQQSPHLVFTPLIISIIGIIGTASALLLYHFIMIRFCLRHRRGSISPSLQQRFPISGIQEEATRSGVDDKILQTIPVLAYSKNNQKGANELFFRTEQNECAVCLGELEEGEMVRLLPTCQHAFHVLCIDNWFLSHSTCPLCRSPAVSLANDCCSSSAASSSSSSTTATPPTAGIEEHHEDGNDGVVRGETSRPRSNGLLERCMSVILQTDRSKPPLLPIQLKRSMSMRF